MPSPPSSPPPTSSAILTPLGRWVEGGHQIWPLQCHHCSHNSQATAPRAIAAVEHHFHHHLHSHDRRVGVSTVIKATSETSQQPPSLSHDLGVKAPLEATAHRAITTGEVTSTVIFATATENTLAATLTVATEESFRHLHQHPLLPSGGDCPTSTAPSSAGRRATL
ncbi:hypothetical protein E2562_034571 [Oryza meyeriana var. granulata]|uniref:Uncharacterized protein n=1 Tax=Oryza meyeriana var. granulata TaxID=110450 RepID=A0A6G1ESQ4_9ORYZ|nr:hypothetical protein E2562_034571 [Oryza meyeriana var. granulata]